MGGKEDTGSRRQHVLALVRMGCTYAQVAQSTGLTRSTVAGIVSRARDAGLMPRRTREAKWQDCSQRMRIERRARRTKPPPTPTPAPAPPPPTVHGPCTFEHLSDRDCRWPLWRCDRDPRLYCGAPAPDRPYCERHRKIAFVRMTPAQAARALDRETAWATGTQQ